MRQFDLLPSRLFALGHRFQLALAFGFRLGHTTAFFIRAYSPRRASQLGDRAG